jgi:outer membrane murein-binding lipoprotein Lpp
MFTRRPGVPVAAALGAIALAIGLSGCAAKVKRDEFNSEVARLREEMQSGDRQVATRVD